MGEGSGLGGHGGVGMTDAAPSALDMSKRNAALMELYSLLVNRSAPAPGSFSSLDEAGRRDYYRDARRRSRARARAAAGAGALEANAANIRDALADAALMILASDAPGADLVMNVLGQAFAARAGVPMLVRERARKGKLRPKLIGCGQ